MKMSEIRELTDDELKQKVEDLREELFNLRFQNARNPLENPLKMRFIRKDIARILTLLTERKNERG
ncbi:MAG: 50S ribosomal protein L29 [Candidatus Cloacimonetes bacterium]|nr:50S ribosomal protein L29 [Candidatus Cloacimonadota bacterium]